MCGYSETKIGNEKISLLLAHDRGMIKIGNNEYEIIKSFQTCDEDDYMIIAHVDKKTELKLKLPERKAIAAKLAKYSKDQIINFILDLVENTGEGYF